MNTIERSYLVRGKQVKLQEIPDLAAVRSDSQRKVKAVSAKMIEGISEEALPSVRAFESAGWTFVPRGQAENGAKVYLEPSGRVTLGTDRLTVRVANGCERDAEKSLEKLGVSVVERLKFAPNLFVVEVPAGQDAVQTAERLAANDAVEFAEPVLIENIVGR